MSCSAEYAPQLRSLGFRVTLQRMAILHVLRHSGGHLSPVEVYSRARRTVRGLTPPTVYRTLDFLAKNGLAWSANSGHGHLVYEIAGNKHHHVICQSCGRATGVKPALLTNVYAKLESASGYLLMRNHVTFFGLCPQCQETRLRKGAQP